ncbi:uncharacterized protein ZBIST_1700 [Zygosaccharomyces bailii]|nr:uncharacterized protein ZBIST_1700 [Zygosaccharomyces bailii]
MENKLEGHSFSKSTSPELETTINGENSPRRCQLSIKNCKRWFLGRRCFLIYKIILLLLLGKLLMLAYYHSRIDHHIVPERRDLAYVDVTSLLRHKSWSRSPLSEKVINQSYMEEEVVGFASNLDKAQVPKKNFDTFPDPSTLITCQDLAWHSRIKHSESIKVLEDNMYEARRSLISQESFLSRRIKNEKEKGMTDRDIIQKKWGQFGGSAVWLESEQCYVMYSRIVWSETTPRNNVQLSLVRAQAFDKDWNEIKGKRIPYADIKVPPDLNAAFDSLDKELGLRDCHQFKDHASHDACIVENTKNSYDAIERKERMISKYYLTYPTVLEVPFNPQGKWRGPEDPHVIVRKIGDFEEPVVIFNMFDDFNDRRMMMAYMPHRKSEPLVKFTINGRVPKKTEKNWAPFFHQHLSSSSISRGFIHFIYSFSPLEILKCSLNDGVCEMVFEADTIKVSDDNKFGGIRGGTQYVPLPDVLPKVAGQQMWIGFPKLHIENCGCGNHYYRPMLSLLVEDHGVYHQELMVPAFTFNMDVLGWDLEGTSCTYINILSPNAIGFWEVASQDPHTEEYEDYLALTISEADFNTRVIYLKGILNFIMDLYKQKPVKDHFEISKEADSIIGETLKCVVSSTKSYCEEYGLAHPVKKDK